MSTFIDAEKMRPKWGDGIVDLRGSPIGDKVEVWEWDRLVYPGRSQRGRRVREHITVMHCPEGWHNNSGGPQTPFEGGAKCATLMDAKWTAGDFPRNWNAYHAEHPVVWVIKVKRHSQVRTLRYCDPELPDEYRPALVSAAGTA